MIVFNHIPRTGGTFLTEKLRASSLLGGPRISLGFPEKWAPDIFLDRELRPVLLDYHVSGGGFAQVYRRRPGDFTFTFLRDRVDMVYSNIAYMRARVERGDPLQPWLAEAARAFLRPLAEQVDEILAAPGPDHEYPPDLALYDFVGITEEMDLSLAVLDRALGTALVNDRRINSVPSEKSYRRQELVAKFARERELYELARHRLTAAARALAE